MTTKELNSVRNDLVKQLDNHQKCIDSLRRQIDMQESMIVSYRAVMDSINSMIFQIDSILDEPGVPAGATHESVYSVASHGTPIHTGDIVSLYK